MNQKEGLKDIGNPKFAEIYYHISMTFS